MRFLDSAADLVSLGFKVFPLVPGSKLPLIKAWQRAASDDADQLAEWSSKWPGANIGIATGEASSVVVLDLDVKDSRSGMEDLAHLARGGKKLPPSPIALTPSGGRHLYFRMAPGLKNVIGVTSAGRGLGPGIDVRAVGGFVVAPPSVLDGGRRYSWLVPPMSSDFPRLPDWALKMLRPPPPPRSAFSANNAGGDIRGLASFAERSPKGERNARLFWASCRAGELVATRSISEAAAVNSLIQAAAVAGLTHHEAMRTIASGFRAMLRSSVQSRVPR